MNTIAETQIVTLAQTINPYTIAELSMQISELVGHEDKMMHPNPEAIAESFYAGKGVFYVNEKSEAIAFCRLIPLLNCEQIENLGLTGICPEVYELGTVIVSTEYRNQGIGKQVVKAIHQINSEAIFNNEMLIIGTTTTIPMLKSLRVLNPVINFFAGSTCRLKFIEALTCMCEPSEPLGGTGVHIQENCHVRAKTNLMLDVSSIHVEMLQTPGCKIFISNLELAEKTNEVLARRMNELGTSRQQFAQWLRADS